MLGRCTQHSSSARIAGLHYLLLPTYVTAMLAVAGWAVALLKGRSGILWYEQILLLTRLHTIEGQGHEQSSMPKYAQLLLLCYHYYLLMYYQRRYSGSC